MFAFCTVIEWKEPIKVGIVHYLHVETCKLLTES